MPRFYERYNKGLAPYPIPAWLWFGLMLFCVHAPGAGRVTILFKAESDAQIFEHFAPWRAQFGIEMDFTPVIGCQDVVDYHKKLFAKMS